MAIFNSYVKLPEGITSVSLPSNLRAIQSAFFWSWRLTSKLGFLTYHIQVRFGARNRSVSFIDPVCCWLSWSELVQREICWDWLLLLYWCDSGVDGNLWGPSIVILGTIAMIHINCSMPTKFPHDLPRARSFREAFTWFSPPKFQSVHHFPFPEFSIVCLVRFT